MQRSASDPFRATWRALVVLSAMAVLLLFGLVALRIGYPFEMEWMEGAMVDEASRVRQGLPSYHPPTTQHVPFLYTPLFYAAGAIASLVTGEGFFAVRLVSVLSTIGCLLLIGSLVLDATGRRRAAVAAMGIFALGYGWLHSWYDLGRNDMLFLAAMLGTWRLLRADGMRPVLLAALVATLAFLAKQTALMWLPALAIGALLENWRRGLAFALATAAGIGGTVLAFDAATEGWFSYYVFAMPRAHVWQGDKLLGFWTVDLVPVLPLLLLAAVTLVERWRVEGPRAALAFGAMAGGGLAASWLSRLHVGGYDNVLVYGFAALCAAGPQAAALAANATVRRVATVLLLVQFAMLVVDVRALGSRPWMYEPSAFLPPAAHEQAMGELRDFVQKQDGPVWVPFQGRLAVDAGKEASAHGQAVVDLLAWIEKPGLPPDDRAAVAFLQSLKTDLEGKRYAAIVLQEPQGAKFTGTFGPFLAGYRLREGAVLSEPTAIRPLVGMVTDRPYVLVRQP